MEILETESLTKSAKKKKDFLDEHARKNNRKISDFFKTPEKQVEKQRQKSLLQFFGKSGQEDEGRLEDNVVAIVDDVIVNGTEVTTPTNSDKENNEVVDDNGTKTEKGESKSKSKKKQRGSESSNDDSNTGLQLKHSQNDSDAVEAKKDKKRKKNRKSKEKRPDDKLSDSVILLSDSSSSNLLSIDSKEVETESNDVPGVESVKEIPKIGGSGQEGKTNCGQGVKATEENEEVEKIESGEECEMDVDDVEAPCKIGMDDFTDKKEETGLKDNEDKVASKISSGNACKAGEMILTKIENSDKISEATNSMEDTKEKSVEKHGTSKQEKTKKIKKSAEYKKVKNLKSESSNAVHKFSKEAEEELVEKVENTVQKEKQGEQMKSEKRKSKKGALKGKDMLNLLKEIQSAESEDKNKKKHRKKHKHNKTKGKQEKEVLEIAVSEDNSEKAEMNIVENEIVEENDKHLLSAECEQDKRSIETCNENGKKATRRSIVKVVKKDVNDGSQKESNIKEDAKQLKNDSIKSKRGRPKKKVVGVSVPGDSNQLSYKHFTETLDCKNSQMQEKKEDHAETKEMSYTEYLQLMEKANAGDSVDLCESDTENVSESSAEEDAVPEENVNSSGKPDEDIPELDTISEKSNIKKFFTVMTSTPDREKVNKKTGKVHSKKTRKAKTSKLTKPTKVTNETEQDKECEIIESKKEVEVELDVETIDVEKTVPESQSEVIKTDVPNNSLFSIKKTQATLSFGKSGLTVSKPVINSDEEDSKDKTNKKCATSDQIEKHRECEVDMKKAEKPKRGRKSRKDTIDLDTTDNSVFATPENVKKRKAKRKLEEHEEEGSESADSGDRRRSLRKRYKVEAFQMDADKKTPIKIKLKRYPKSSSSGEDIEKSSLNVRKLKPTVKQTTALALLEKAKRGKRKKHKMNKDKETFSLKKQKESKKQKKDLKKRNESNSSEDSVTRRSSRLEGRVMASMEEVSLENIVISSSEDEGDGVKKVKKRGRPKGSKKVIGELPKKAADTDIADNKSTPKKDGVKKKIGSPCKSRTPSKKTGMKLAPMFLMGKNKPAEPSPKKPPLDPELVKQRQQFLMSGVPEELQKQTATRIASQVDADYPPIPKTSHVLQAPADLVSSQTGMINVWDLSPVELKLRHVIIPISIHPLARFTGSLINGIENKSVDFDRMKNFKLHAPIPDDMIELCQKEIACFNSTYPVTSMYKALKEMKTETEKPPPKSESMLKTDMKGILDGCTDMVVIDEGDEDQGKKKKKKSLKLQKKEKTEEKVEEPKVEDKPKVTGSSLLWTEKYCPAKTSEVLGNSGVMKKLKTWLTEWKHVLDREARKARKLLMKKNRGKQLPSKKDADDLWDDDSDFDMDSEDSDDDDSLCNTMLLSGPHGCGKTSSVYALALELGFKVHEVNASSCRSGKQILSQLQEATQSHQVSSQGNHTPRKNTALGDKSKPENKMPTAFTNLFKKAAAPAAESKQEEKQAGRKRKRNKSDKEGNPENKREKRGNEMKHKSLQLVIEDSNSQSAAKSLNLSSTTLILFDEVDIVFDEDRGFLSAIQNFMSNTKIPIVLTTADPGFTDTFDGRYEQMNFKRPSVASITTHLQTISLVENMRTDPITLAELAQFYHCDMRRCLVALQYLLESGGGHTISHKVIQVVKNSQKTADALGLEMENSQSSIQSDSYFTLKTEKLNIDQKSEMSRDVDNSDDDFVSIKPLKKRRRVLEDDNSNSVDTCSQVTLNRQTEVIAVDDNEEVKNYPPVQSIGLESLIGGRDISIADFLTQGLKAKSAATLQEMICTCCCIKQTSGMDPFYNNLHIVLPFTTKVVDSVFKVSQDSSNSKSKKRKRIRIESDLYDSEASNDASNVEHSDNKLEEEIENDRTESEKLAKGSRVENLCLAKSLSHFTRFYDTMSSLDVLESNDRMKICDKMQSFKGRDVKGTLVAGVGNELASFPTQCELDLDSHRMYSSEIETRSICKMYRECSAVKEEAEKLNGENETFAENFTLLVSRQNEHFTLVDNSSISIPAEYRRACDNSVDNLPLVSHSHLRTVHLDYLPTLREICRTEQCRQVTNTKRRFHHYLDSITLPLKDRTMSTLATTFV
ncbi:ATPase family AAA domain-containing protein 5-like [Mercenaria mercenaria]|uniref:ATPase family AAA domain-containing protein 5-like n=1 Tax=Mercenaria mercenaria TaxID=6596 RepID=UPI00234EE130|nr:ATPase family AAA domain-containing protein 5-like [Mercenaria mercenaria]